MTLHSARSQQQEAALAASVLELLQAAEVPQRHQQILRRRALAGGGAAREVGLGEEARPLRRVVLQRLEGVAAAALLLRQGLLGGLASSAYFFDAMSLSSLTSAFSLSSVSRPAMYDGAPLSSASVTKAMRLPRGGAGAVNDGCGIALRASSAGRSGSGAGAGAGAASSR